MKSYLYYNELNVKNQHAMIYVNILRYILEKYKKEFYKENTFPTFILINSFMLNFIIDF